VSVKVYLEGGGRGSNRKGRKGGRSEQSSKFREGFSKFVRKVGLTGKMPQFVPCGSRETAFKDFRKAVESGEAALLLVDAEKPVTVPGPWQHLKDSDNWNRPEATTDDHCHLMVQVMESWFLADTAALKSYFRQGFQEGALPQNPKIEQIPKRDIERKLRQATRNSSKGEYSKGKHSFEILAELDPAKVRCKSPYADRFLCELERRSQE
jgi:hypothetical protein